MPELYPEIEPYDRGMLDVGDGNLIYWELCGNPSGQPAVVLHGGPGSACSRGFRRFFNPRAYRVALFDQRNCGRSKPHASDPAIDLSTNTTNHLLADIERLRRHLDVDRWLVLGGSWGCTLGLAYAERHPERVAAMVLFGVTTGRHEEIDWLFRGGLARFFPEEWQRLIAFAPSVDAHARLLFDADPGIRRAAAEEWCRWESATPHWPPRHELDERFKDPAYALCFARIVTHYVRHNLFLEDAVLLGNAGVLAGIPGVLVHGRFDFQSPVANAWALKRAWPRADLVIVDGAGHGADAKVSAGIVRATDRLARLPNG